MDETTATGAFGEKTKAQAEEAFERMTSAAQEATNAAQSTVTGAVEGAREFNMKVMGIARSNINSAFDFAEQLLAVKSLPDLLELSNTHARKQMDALPVQTKELTEAAQKMAKDTAEPFAAGIAKATGRTAA